MFNKRRKPVELLLYEKYSKAFSSLQHIHRENKDLKKGS